MLNAQGKPRYWLGAYDAWHLMLPVALAAVLVVWALAPRPPAPRRVATAPSPPLAPSSITQPAAGAELRARQFQSIQGVAPPQARVFLFLRQIPRPEQLLGETRSATNGAFLFTMAGFPPGDYGFRIEAVAADGRRSPSPEISVRLTPEPPPTPHGPAGRAPAAVAPRKPKPVKPPAKPPAKAPAPARKTPARD